MPREESLPRKLGADQLPRFFPPPLFGKGDWERMEARW